MSELAFRETVTVFDALDARICIDGVLKFIAESGLISVATSEFPDNRHVQLAALMHGGRITSYGYGYGDKLSFESGNGTGYGCEYGDISADIDTECDGYSNTYTYDYGRSFQNGYGPRNGDGIGFGIGKSYGYGYSYGDGCGEGWAYGRY